MIYFSSDHHFHHSNIIRYCNRPFDTVAEMDEELVRRWNATILPEDTIYYLGDFSLSKSAVHDVLPRLQGEKHLIMGNHDQCHPCNGRKAKKALSLYLEAGFKTIQLTHQMEIARQTVLLSHMPYLTKEEAEGYNLRYTEYRLENHGQWLLHGHVHCLWKTNQKMINVGADVWDYYPVSIEKIESLIQETAISP